LALSVNVIVGSYSRASLGHVIRCCRLAAFLRRRGHQILFLCAEEALEVPRRFGLAVATVPELPPAPVAYGLSDDAIRRSTSGRMASPDYLRTCLARDRELMAAFRPHAVVADLRPTLSVAAAISGVPALSITNGKMLRHPTNIVFTAIVDSLEGIGVPPELSPKIFGDLMGILGFAALEPLGDVHPQILEILRRGGTAIRHLGPLIPETEPGAGVAGPALEGDGTGPLWYVSFGGAPEAAPLLEAVLEMLAHRRERFVVHRGPHLSEAAVREAMGSARLAASFAFATDNCAILGKCSAALVHGGHGTMYDCLLAGVPSVIVPRDEEQRSNGEIVAGLGAGVCLGPGPSCADLDRAMDAALDDGSYSRRASALRDELGRGNALREIAELLERYAL
jgi:UDP:flavonoid glycosyltransferase YjiC (YdhE family)